MHFLTVQNWAKTWIWVWNELAIALGLTFFEAQPITVGVASFRGYASINWGGMTGSAIVSMIPMILFAAFAQKHIVKGLTLGSVKGWVKKKIMTLLLLVEVHLEL